MWRTVALVRVLVLFGLAVGSALVVFGAYNILDAYYWSWLCVNHSGLGSCLVATQTLYLNYAFPVFYGLTVLGVALLGWRMRHQPIPFLHLNELQTSSPEK